MPIGTIQDHARMNYHPTDLPIIIGLTIYTPDIAPLTAHTTIPLNLIAEEPVFEL